MKVKELEIIKLFKPQRNIFYCKNCGAEYELSEIDFEAPVYCEICGGLELQFLCETKAA